MMPLWLAWTLLGVIACGVLLAFYAAARQDPDGVKTFFVVLGLLAIMGLAIWAILSIAGRYDSARTAPVSQTIGRHPLGTLSGRAAWRGRDVSCDAGAVRTEVCHVNHVVRADREQEMSETHCEAAQPGERVRPGLIHRFFTPGITPCGTMLGRGQRAVALAQSRRLAATAHGSAAGISAERAESAPAGWDARHCAHRSGPIGQTDTGLRDVTGVRTDRRSAEGRACAAALKDIAGSAGRNQHHRKVSSAMAANRPCAEGAQLGRKGAGVEPRRRSAVTISYRRARVGHPWSGGAQEEAAAGADQRRMHESAAGRRALNRERQGAVAGLATRAPRTTQRGRA